MQDELKTCTLCSVSKPRSEFGKRSAAKDGLQPRCLVCQRSKMREHYRSNVSYYVAKAAKRNGEERAAQREWLKDYLLSHPCVDCGEGDLRCLQFDHITGDKVFEVSNMFKRMFSTEKIRAEIEKCVVRCANCHQRKTAADFNWWSHTAMTNTPICPHATNVLEG